MNNHNRSTFKTQDLWQCFRCQGPVKLNSGWLTCQNCKIKGKPGSNDFKVSLPMELMVGFLGGQVKISSRIDEEFGIDAKQGHITGIVLEGGAVRIKFRWLAVMLAPANNWQITQADDLVFGLYNFNKAIYNFGRLELETKDSGYKLEFLPKSDPSAIPQPVVSNRR